MTSRLVARLSRDFLEADTRGLAVFRFFYGLVCLWCLFSRTLGDRFVAFHTDYGVLPTPLAIERPLVREQWSLFFGLARPLEVAIGFGVAAIFFVWLTIGYRTRTAAIGAYVAILSLHFRNHFIVSGAMSIMNVIGLFTVALPLGRHYSVDAWLRRRRREPLAPLPNERVKSLAFLAFRFEVFCIYFFNVFHKNGETWRDGTAVHYALNDDRITMITAKWLRDVAPRGFYPVATYGTLAVELLIALALLSPFAVKNARRLAALLIVALHLAIGSVLQLGPFPAVLSSVAIFLLAGGSFDAFHGTLARLLNRWPRVSRIWQELDPALDPVAPRDPSALRRERASVLVRESWFAYVFVVLVLLNRHDNRGLDAPLGRIELPAFARVSSDLFFIRQGWALFAPDPARDTGLFVVDLELEDGRHVDPLTHAAPDFGRFGRGPFGTDYFWQVYEPRLVMARADQRVFDAFLAYLLRVPVLEAWPGERRVRSLEVWYVLGRTPPPGQPRPPPERKLLARRDSSGHVFVAPAGDVPPIAEPLSSAGAGASDVRLR